ncbi:hypothetical protein ACFOMP_10810, partial [Paracoccus simplex]
MRRVKTAGKKNRRESQGRDGRGMARGFAAGLVHGALICGLGLAALSLALPQPPRPAALPATDRGGDVKPPVAPQKPPESAAATPAVTPAAEPPADQVAKPAEPAGPAEPPATTALSVPAESEFARGTDMQPQRPAPLA